MKHSRYVIFAFTFITYFFAQANLQSDLAQLEQNLIQLSQKLDLVIIADKFKRSVVFDKTPVAQEISSILSKIPNFKMYYRDDVVTLKKLTPIQLQELEAELTAAFQTYKDNGGNKQNFISYVTNILEEIKGIRATP